jgi:hypothetical protein
MYIRIKRRNETVFLWTSPSDTFAQVKQRVADIFSTEPNNILLLANDKVLLAFWMENFKFIF